MIAKRQGSPTSLTFDNVVPVVAGSLNVPTAELFRIFQDVLHPWVIVRYLGVLPDRSVHTWYGTDGPHLTLCLGLQHPLMTRGTGKVGEPLRDLGTCLEEGKRGNPLANGQYSLGS